MLADYLEKIRTKTNVLVLKAVIYARYSSDMQRSESIAAQIRFIREFAKNNNIIIVSEYIDEAQSAKRDDREAFQQMMKDSKSAEWQIVLVHKLDRFARNRFDSATYRIHLRKNRKYLISAVEQFDDSPESAMLEAVIEAMSEYYSKNLAREVMKGLTENALKGKNCGGTPPLGYDLDEHKFYKINAFEAQGVKLIFKLFLDGKTYSEIISILNAAGYRTKCNRLFSRNSLYEILRNEKYKGIFVYNKTQSRDEITGKRSGHRYKSEDEVIRINGVVPQLISPEDWDVAQSILNNRKKAYGNNAKETYLLSGKIKCGKCGGSYVGRRVFNSCGVKYIYYACNEKRNPNFKCDNSSVRRDWIEDMVVKKVIEFVREFNGKYFEDIQSEYIKEVTDCKKKEIMALRSKLNSIDADIQRLVDAISKCSLESLINKLELLEQQKKEIQADIDKFEIPDNNFSIEQIKKLLSKAEQMLEEESTPLKELINLVVKEIVVNESDIQIYMNCFDKTMTHKR